MNTLIIILAATALILSHFYIYNLGYSHGVKRGLQLAEHLLVKIQEQIQENIERLN